MRVPTAQSNTVTLGQVSPGEVVIYGGSLLLVTNFSGYLVSKVAAVNLENGTMTYLSATVQVTLVDAEVIIHE